MSALLNLIYRVNAKSIKTLASYFLDIDKLTLTCIFEDKRFKTVNPILKEKNKVGELTLANFITYSETTEIKTLWDW